MSFLYLFKGRKYKHVYKKFDKPFLEDRYDDYVAMKNVEQRGGYSFFIENLFPCHCSCWEVLPGQIIL